MSSEEKAKWSLATTPLSRREALKILGGTGAALPWMSSWASESAKKLESSFVNKIGTDAEFLKNYGPLRILDDESEWKNQKEFSGDNPSKAHPALWNKEGFLAEQGGLPKPSEEAKLVVVGGGVAGLMSAFLQADLKPVVLEQAPRFGGNSKGESWRGIDYALGAAYIAASDEGTLLDQIHKKLGLEDLCRKKPDFDPIIYNKKRFDHFWNAETDPQRSEQFERLNRYFLAMLKGEKFEGKIPRYPNVPIEDPKDRKYVEELDKFSFKEHLEKIAGGKLHPHIETLIEHYCWSSFGASMTEVSAASGLNYYVAEFGDILVPPGGNSSIAEVILKKLLDKVPASHLRTSALVIDVRVEGKKTIVTYVDESMQLRSISANAVVMSCPKFVVSRVLNGIEEKRKNAISRLKYRSYLVASAWINQGVEKDSYNDSYDLYLIGKGEGWSDPQLASLKQKSVDVVLASFSKPNSKETILTLYRPMPFDGARGMLLDEGSFKKFQKEFEQELADEILPLFGWQKKNMLGLRCTRWGHPLPVAEKNLIADGVLDEIRKPFKDKVFFVEQDNWASPAFEISAIEAMLWKDKIRKAAK